MTNTMDDGMDGMETEIRAASDVVRLNVDPSKRTLAEVHVMVLLDEVDRLRRKAASDAGAELKPCDILVHTGGSVARVARIEGGEYCRVAILETPSRWRPLGRYIVDHLAAYGWGQAFGEAPPGAAADETASLADAIHESRTTQRDREWETMTPPRRIVCDAATANRHGPAASWRRRYDELLRAVEYTSWHGGATEQVHAEAIAHARALCQQIYERNRMDREGPEVEQSYPAVRDDG
jgi:hypothetical protein